MLSHLLTNHTMLGAMAGLAGLRFGPRFVRWAAHTLIGVR